MGSRACVMNMGKEVRAGCQVAARKAVVGGCVLVDRDPGQQARPAGSAGRGLMSWVCTRQGSTGKGPRRDRPALDQSIEVGRWRQPQSIVMDSVEAENQGPFPLARSVGTLATIGKVCITPFSVGAQCRQGGGLVVGVKENWAAEVWPQPCRFAATGFCLRGGSEMLRSCVGRV